jgi:hypothetical protein
MQSYASYVGKQGKYAINKAIYKERRYRYRSSSIAIITVSATASSLYSL